MKYTHVTHEDLPLFIDENSQILILGSLPSVKSREAKFYYAHPQNRFFKTLAGVFGEPEPVSIQQRKDFLAAHRIALFDVVQSCDIRGSSDSSIVNAQPNDIDTIVNTHHIKMVFINGQKAQSLYQKFDIQSPFISLPSTSPANAVFTLERLIQEYAVIKEYLSF